MVKYELHQRIIIGVMGEKYEVMSEKKIKWRCCRLDLNCFKYYITQLMAVYSSRNSISNEWEVIWQAFWIFIDSSSFLIIYWWGILQTAQNKSFELMLLPLANSLVLLDSQIIGVWWTFVDYCPAFLLPWT